MTDESTDISVLKQHVLIGRHLTDEGVKTSFLCIKDIPNGTAETIEEAMLNYVGDKVLQITRLSAFGSDGGAAVMTGRLSGVAVRLTRHSPRMIAVHCINHRLQLMLLIQYLTFRSLKLSSSLCLSEQCIVPTDGQ